MIYEVHCDYGSSGFPQGQWHFWVNSTKLTFVQPVFTIGRWTLSMWSWIKNRFIQIDTQIKFKKNNNSNKNSLTASTMSWVYVFFVSVTHTPQDGSKGTPTRWLTFENSQIIISKMLFKVCSNEADKHYL